MGKKTRFSKGNTIKWVPEKAKYQKTPYVMKKIHNVDKSQENQYMNIVENNLSEVNILYSMNKKKRWDLADKISEIITDIDHSEDSYQISLYRCDKVIKPAFCTDYKSSKGPIRSVSPTRSRYVNIKNVLSPGPPKSRRRKRRRTEANTANQNPDCPEVAYSFFYPVSGSSDLSNNLKYLDYHIDSYNVKERDNKTKVKHSLKLISILDEYDCISSISLTDEDEDGSCCDCDCDVSDSISRSNVCQGHRECSELQEYISFELFHKESFSIKKNSKLSKFERSRKCGNDSDETCYVDKFPSYEVADTNKNKGYCFKCDCDTNEFYVRHLSERKQRQILRNEAQKEDKDAMAEYLKRTKSQLLTEEVDVHKHRSVSPVELKPVQIIFYRDELLSSNLRHCFGSKYRESNTCNRRFIIDITSEVNKYLYQSNILRASNLHQQDLYSLLVFTYQTPYSHTSDIYNVSFNSQLRMNCVKIETLFDLQPCTLDEVLSATLLFLDTLPHSCFSPSQPIMKPPTRVLKSNPLKSTPTMGINYFDSSQGYRSLLEQEQNRVKQNAMIDISKTIDMSEIIDTSNIMNTAKMITSSYCSVCYRDIESVGGSALSTCQHWFCDNCWSNYLTEKILTGFLKPIFCPEYGCESQVDHVTAETFVSVNIYRPYLQRIFERQANATQHNLWCPNPRCNVLLQLPFNYTRNGCVINDMSLRCMCGVTFCGKCLGNTHWPASCSDNRLYHEKVKNHGDEALLDHIVAPDYVVDVKQCPKCTEPINKNGGCPHMVCVCGHQFCWSCLGNWPEKTPCSSRVPNDARGCEQVVISDEDRLTSLLGRNRSKFYLLSLQNRRELTMLRVRRLHNQKNSLSAHIMKSLLRHNLVPGKDVVKCFNGALENDGMLVKKDILDFMEECMNAMLDLHDVLQNSYVILEFNTLRKGCFVSLKQIINKASFIVLRLHQIYEIGESLNPQKVVIKLSRLREYAKECIRDLSSWQHKQTSFRHSVSPKLK